LIGDKMKSDTQRNRAVAFRDLHKRSEILVLPNAWDVASARIFEEAGFPAIGTTSAGIAASLGYPDGQRISRDEMVQVVGRIAAAVKVPVSVDIEAGFGDRVEDVTKTVLAVLKTGAVGINLEDTPGNAGSPLVELPRQLEKISAARQAALSAGIPLVLNARTDVYWLAVGDPEKRFELAVQRAHCRCRCSLGP
jgi:2-methylisocitrate lyase-like PEP mutase family enzyme